jgi:hypothetical protein
MPFKILALASFGSMEDDPWKGKPLRVEKTNIDNVMHGFGLSLDVPVPKDLCPEQSLVVKFSRLKDFHPDTLLQNNVFSKNLLDAKRFFEEGRAKGLSDQKIAARLEEWPGVPAMEFPAGSRRPDSRGRGGGDIDNILKMVALPEERPPSPVETHPWTAKIDRMLEQVLRHVFLCEEFRNVEAVWRGLHFLLQQGGANGELQVEICPVSLETIEGTLSNLIDDLLPDPPSIIIIDLPFDDSPHKLEILQRIGEFAGTILVPALTWLTPRFFNMESWEELNRLPYLPHHLEGSAFAKWRRLKSTSSARWLAITCNRPLVRYPYGPDNMPALVGFKEPCGLFCSPTWAIGSLIGQSILKTGWPTRFTDWKRIRLENLPLHPLDSKTFLPLEADFSEERVHQFAKAGIIPLVSTHNKDVAFTPLETTLSGDSLSYQLLVSRIVQFVFRCKDEFGEGIDPEALQRDLERAFLLFWEKSGHSAPDQLEFKVTQPDIHKPPLLKMLIVPSRDVLSPSEKIELELNW